MLYGFLVTGFIVVCFLLISVVLIQQSKGGMGLGGMGGQAQMLFGGSGGQDLLQKITWVLVVIFMSGSLILALMRSAQRDSYRYVTRARPIQQMPAPQPGIPASATK
ncbi:preprotein translocase subunit SecG [Candidatus Dependentiae bacterium]|nr:preprotein translocase subunit SecG [Candidatus Dependentiae bacterium]